MRRAVKIVLWTGVFLACAGIGAFVAAHTDPFPPGVVDPGANPAASVSSEVPPGEALVQIDLRTFHDLYVGGRCAISWRIDVGLDVTGDEVEGTGSANARSNLRCDEPSAQIQADVIDLAATGTIVAGELHFRLEETGRTPMGSQELTGFAKTIPTLRFELSAHQGANASFNVEIPDRDRGSYGAAGTVTVLTLPAA
jgi:hypothetical protein